MQIEEQDAPTLRTSLCISTSGLAAPHSQGECVIAQKRERAKLGGFWEDAVADLIHGSGVVCELRRPSLSLALS